MIQNNFVSSLTGIVGSEPKQIKAPQPCVSFNMLIKRSSGYCDCVEVILPITKENAIPNISKGDSVRVIGFVYTYQNNEQVYPKLRVCIYATGIVKTNYPTNKNIIICQGTIVKQPKLRKTPAGKTICDILLAVNNEIDGLYACYIPVVAWNQRALELQDCHVRTNLYIIGRLQSREYSKLVDGIQQVFTTHELSINSFKFLEE